MKNKFKFIIIGFTLVLLIGIYVIVNSIKNSEVAEENSDKGIYYGVVESTGNNTKVHGKSANNNLFESPLKNEKEINITDRNFLSWFDELEHNPESYSGRSIEMNGNVFNILIDMNIKPFVGRYVLTSPLEKKEMQGIIIKTDKSFSNDEWVYVKGTMDTDIIHGVKVPVIRVEYIEKVQNKGADFIYGY